MKNLPGIFFAKLSLLSRDHGDFSSFTGGSWTSWLTGVVLDEGCSWFDPSSLSSNLIADKPLQSQLLLSSLCGRLTLSTSVEFELLFTSESRTSEFSSDDWTTISFRLNLGILSSISHSFWSLK